MNGVLVLNASYEPLNIVSVKRAVVLLLKEKAELVEAAQTKIRAEHLQIDVPLVIRLVTFVPIPRRLPLPLSRRTVLARDLYTCQYCGEKLAHRDATLDHVVPQWKCKKTGQPANTWTNTVTSCRACQARKGGRSVHEAGMHFFDPNFEPKIPRATYLVLTSDVLPEWKQYIQI